MNENKKDFDGKGLGVNLREGISYDDLEEEQNIYNKDQRRLDRKFNSVKYPNFKLTAEYLTRKTYSGVFKLDKKIICEELKIAMHTLNLFLSELNRFEKFQPMRWISISGEKDFIEVAGVDFKNSNKWIKRNYKGLISRTTRTLQTKEKVKIKEEEIQLQEFRKRQIKKIKIKNIK